MATGPVTARVLQGAPESIVDGVAAQQIAVRVTVVPDEMAQKVATQGEVPGAIKIAVSITQVPGIMVIAVMSLPIAADEDTAVAADTAMDITPVLGIMGTTDTNSPIVADEDTAVAVDTVMEITRGPDIMVIADMNLPIAADEDTAVAVNTVTVITLDPGILVTTDMNLPIEADEDTAVATDTGMGITPVLGIMVTTDTNSLIVAADVDPAVEVDTVTVITLDPDIPAMNSPTEADEVMTITLLPGIMDMTGTSSPTVELRIIAATASLDTVTTRLDHMLVLITLIRDMSSLTAAAGDAVAEAWDILLVGVVLAPELNRTTLALTKTRVKRLGIKVLPPAGRVELAAPRLVLQVPDGQVSVDRALVVRVLPGRSSRSICWNAQTRTRTAS